MDFNHEPMSDVFDKWHVDGLPIAAVIDRFSAPDFGDPHDHPWGFQSVILAGGYVEEVFQLDGSSDLVKHAPGDSFTIKASHIHRIVELIDGECWTMIMPDGPAEKTSGFYQFRDDGTHHRFWHQTDFHRMQGRQQ